MEIMNKNIYSVVAGEYEEEIQYKTLLQLWLQSTKHNIKESTYARYYQLIVSHIIPDLGELYTRQITTGRLNQEIERLLTAGNLNNPRGLSPKMVSDILSIIKRSIGYGIAEGCRIPCDLQKISVKKTNKKMRVLDRMEQGKLQKTLITNTDGYKIGTLCSLYTGMRIGELCALRWEDIDLHTRVLHIRKTLQRVKDFSTVAEKKTKLSISTPKSQDSIRDIPIPDFLVTYLKELQSDENHYFLTGCEKSTEPRVVQYRFKEYIKESKIEDANFHSLRHTFATRAIECGFDLKSLSEILGHSNVNMTLNRYVHASFELKKDNMNKLSLF